MMLMLAVAAARFFRPALAEAVTLAGLSEDTAGATLLSLANGIPHVAKMLSAPDTAPGGLLMESSVLVTVRPRSPHACVGRSCITVSRSGVT